MEPYKIRTVEHLNISSRDERERVLKLSGYNTFLVSSRYVTYDLLTDSGTGGMSGHQWSAVLNGDESYAGARSFHHLEDAGKTLTGMPYILPVHQARAAERILFQVIVKNKGIVIGNGFLDTARIHLQRLGATPIDISIEHSKTGHFNGDVNLQLLEKYITRPSPKVCMVYISVTCHRLGGQPVSMACIQSISKLCRKHQIPFYLDAAHYATNCWFIKLNERDFRKQKPFQIAKEMFGSCDGCLISAKKDGHCNTGALLATRLSDHHAAFSQHLILTEGFLTYGGMTGRDMEAAAIGLLEALEESYVRFRVECLQMFGEMLKKRSVPIIEPVGSHAVCVDAGTLLSHLDSTSHPAWALSCALFIEGGIRGAEDGNVMNCGSSGESRGPNSASREQRQLYRLSVPPRTYTMSHLEHISNIVLSVVTRRTSISGMRLVKSSEVLGHFNATFQPINKDVIPKDMVKNNKPANVMNGYRRN